MTESLKPIGPAGPQSTRRWLPRRISVRALLVVMILLATLPVLAVVVVASLVEQGRQVERAAQEMDVLAALLGSGQEQLVEGTAQMLTAVTNAPAVTGNDLPLCTQYVERLRRQSPDMVNVGIINLAGNLTCRAVPPTGDIRLGDRIYFRNAIATGKLSIGEFVIGRTTGMKTINFGMPVKGDDGITKGVAFVAIDLKKVDRKLRSIGIPAGMEVRVTDARGTVLANIPADFSYVGAPVADAVVLKAIRAGHDGRVAPAADDPLHRHHVLQPVAVSGRPGLFVVLSASHDSMLAPAVRSLMLQVAAILLLVSAAALVSWALSDRLLARPLQQLLDGVGALGKDDTAGSPRLPRGRVREITQLQLALLRMAQTVRRRRQQRDRALEESTSAQQGMVEILDRMSEGFVVVDEAWKLTYLNQRAIDMLQKGRSDLTGESFWSLFPDEPGETIRRACERALTKGRSWDFEKYYPGFGRWFEVRLFPSPDGIGVFLHDSTERRQTLEALREREVRYRELFEFNPHVMWVYDVETLRFLAVNEAAIAKYNYTPQEFLAMTIADVRPEEDTEELMEFVSTPQTVNTALGDARIWRHRKQDGTVFLVEVVTRPITFDDRPARLVLVTDATERQVVDSRLRRSQTRLERALEEKTRDLDLAGKVLESFSYLVSHDLRSPLQVIDGFSRELAVKSGDNLGEQGRHYISRIRASTQRMGLLIDAMLLLSRVTRAPIRNEQVDLAPLAQSVVDERRAAGPGRNVTVDVERPMICTGDPGLLKLVMASLVDNAWKFTSRRPAGAWIRIGQKISEDAREMVYFVSDNGAGFDMAYADKLFVAFQRLHSTAEFEGAGVGLAIAHRIVTRHGGRIWAESGSSGSTFFFTIGPPR
ncbi:MAG: PAS domain S-box protein [Bdellovibrionales bacterium]|nr:PAS domain S-box protein [Ramlibacter sp.]